MIKAILSFGFLQALNFLTPVVLIGILARSESNEALIVYLLMQSVSAFLAIAVEYGFYLSAVRRVSHARKFCAVGDACSLINASKILIYCFIVIMALVDALFFKRYELEIYVGILLAVFVIGMRPLWYYQGANSYKIMIYAEAIVAISTLAIMIYVSGRSISGSNLFVISFVPRLLLTLYLIGYIHIKEGLTRVGILPVMVVIKESFFLFFHRVAAGVLHYAVPVIIGLYFTSADLLAYQKADRLFYLFQSVSLIFSQVVFTRLVTKVALLRREKFFAIFMQFIISLVLATVLYFFSPYLLNLYYGEVLFDSVAVLKRFSLIIPLMGVNAAMGLTFFVAENDDHIVVYTAVMGAVATLLMLWIKPFNLGLLVGVYSIFLGELVILFGMLYFIIRKKN